MQGDPAEVNLENSLKEHEAPFKVMLRQSIASQELHNEDN